MEEVLSFVEGTRRFNEFRRLLPDVTQRMLTLQLRELEEAGVVHRDVYKVYFPRKWSTLWRPLAARWSQSSF